MCIAINCLTLHTPCGHQTADCTPSCSPWRHCKSVRETVQTFPEYADIHCETPSKTIEDLYNDAKHTSDVHCGVCIARMSRSRETLMVPESLVEIDAAEPQAMEALEEDIASESSDDEESDDLTEGEMATLSQHMVGPEVWQWNVVVVEAQEYDDPDPMDLDQPGWQQREGVACVSPAKTKQRSWKIVKRSLPARKKSLSVVGRPASIANAKPCNWLEAVQAMAMKVRRKARKKEGVGWKREKEKKERGFWPWRRRGNGEDEMMCD